jgi:predicted ribosomally synthesized peptide with nif11-like leader
MPRPGDADNTFKEASMKTIEEFIHRLKNDPEFEQQAHAYEDSDEFLHFLKSEGYDFTLDQLLDIFKDEEVAELMMPTPVAAPGVEAFIQRLKDDPEFERQAQAFENDDAFMEFVQKAGYNFNLDQLMTGFKRGPESLNPQTLVSPPPLKVAASPTLRLPDGSDSLHQADHSSPDAPAQKQTVKLIPKFEGVSGGRRRGIKWRNTES